MLIFHVKSFKKDFQKLPASFRKMFEKKMTIFLKNEFDPLLRNHKLNPPWEGYRSIDITGDIRLIYKKEEGVYRLYRIGTHSELYE
jgi:addiction module RelE/StbE family toxin